MPVVAGIPVYIGSVWRTKRLALLIIGIACDEEALARLPSKPTEPAPFACTPIAVSVVLVFVAPWLAHLDGGVVDVW